MIFEWDENKNKHNIIKHKIDFNEAKSVFYDSNALLIYDPDHSIEENRFILLGLSSSLNILIVSHCYKEDDRVIRIISARKATKKEILNYRRNKQ